MQRRDTDRTPNEWISLVSQPVFQRTVVEDGRREPAYSEYPFPVIYPDMLPPDYPALLALLFLFTSVVQIRFNEIDYMQSVVSIVLETSWRNHH